MTPQRCLPIKDLFYELDLSFTAYCKALASRSHFLLP